ncbi:hypothetical protein TREES_T100001738 [Tupaia chinensis]|uniref:Uncharacterized protein n=1 Tax=Tupaia chinensis TaxID=246437 RepID=L9KJ47_TUPCH|nr:hypothetical protein TREES_T100001738 [Tupaia chinensis]
MGQRQDPQDPFLSLSPWEEVHLVARIPGGEDSSKHLGFGIETPGHSPSSFRSDVPEHRRYTPPAHLIFSSLRRASANDQRQDTNNAIVRSALPTALHVTRSVSLRLGDSSGKRVLSFPIVTDAETEAYQQDSLLQIPWLLRGL